ncbi:hypothetical protein D0469_03885 [Peribacillus saganii]|uniref:Uncharacterized protein n=1 Tax=Peribacillus saganii TaxID=2303992 RepID=A0A372LSC9_9BACI|nr:hypothetical protein [Peribacillus saganii]RFU71088.1 hypothetical protein D0469_03885 [Peribacillus saganii]
MSQFIVVLIVISAVIVGFALAYTFSIARNQRVLKGEFDSSIDEKVQSHPYIRNPVFLTFFIFVLVVILFIVYYSFKY